MRDVSIWDELRGLLYAEAVGVVLFVAAGAVIWSVIWIAHTVR